MEHEIDRIECAIRHIESSLDVDPWACEIAVHAMRELIKPTEPPRWVPVTEALPEEGVAVLTQAQFRDDVKFAVSARIDFNYWTGWGTRDINITAWMPLPEPWREQE